jgi:hypothetical protein
LSTDITASLLQISIRSDYLGCLAGVRFDPRQNARSQAARNAKAANSEIFVTIKLNEIFKEICTHRGNYSASTFEEAMHPRRFNRVRPAGRMPGSAKLIVGPKLPVIDCSVVDYSAGGACIEICGPVKLPSRFEILYAGSKKRCRVVWNNGRRFGLSF